MFDGFPEVEADCCVVFVWLTEDFCGSLEVLAWALVVAKAAASRAADGFRIVSEDFRCANCNLYILDTQITHRIIFITYYMILTNYEIVLSQK